MTKIDPETGKEYSRHHHDHKHHSHHCSPDSFLMAKREEDTIEAMLKERRSRELKVPKGRRG